MSSSSITSTSVVSTLRKSFRMPWKTGKRYNILEGKENIYFNTPKPNKQYKRAMSESDIARHKVTARPGMNRKQAAFERNTNLTKSVREAVGSLKQKFRASTRRLKRLNEGPRTPSPSKIHRGHARKGVKGHVVKTPPNKKQHEVKMYSPFTIDTPSTKRTPSRIKTVSTYPNRGRQDQLQTPTRLKKEVEALTANMQALATLTPGTLQNRVKTRRSGVSPLTNGSLCTRPPTTPGTRSSSRLEARRRMSINLMD